MYNPEQPSFDGRLPEKPPVWQRLGGLPVRHGNIAGQQRNRELLQVATAQTTPSVSTPGIKIRPNSTSITDFHSMHLNSDDMKYGFVKVVSSSTIFKVESFMIL